MFGIGGRMATGVLLSFPARSQYEADRYSASQRTGLLRGSCRASGRIAAVSATSPGSIGAPIDAAVAEIEGHVHAAGWDRPPALFALVRAAEFARDEPETAALLGVDASAGDALTPIEQDALPEGDIDTALARIAWPAPIAGCALSQEILILPPSAEAEFSDPSAAAQHPERREARLVVGVLRDGSSAAVLRLRDADDDLLTGPDLVPNLVAALLATLSD
jgi:hypothetical protein